MPCNSILIIMYQNCDVLNGNTLGGAYQLWVYEVSPIRDFSNHQHSNIYSKKIEGQGNLVIKVTMADFLTFL